MRVTSIPPSGWPSRPRNLGLQMARGTYVVFMDHDDELYPTGLEDAWSFAARHALDALTAKETKTSSRFFTWGAFLSDVAPPEPRRPLLLSPMTPHKMYRREYLLEHAIEFPEGGPDVGKVQWEDIHFNIDVYSHSERLGVLASRPFYHWVTGTGSNSSASYTRIPRVLRHLAGVFAHISKASLSEEDADWIRAGNYVNRVLSKMVGPGGLKCDAEYYARTLELAAAFTQRWVPLRVDAQLEGTSRVRSRSCEAIGGNCSDPSPCATGGSRPSPWPPMCGWSTVSCTSPASRGGRTPRVMPCICAASRIGWCGCYRRISQWHSRQDCSMSLPSWSRLVVTCH